MKRLFVLRPILFFACIATISAIPVSTAADDGEDPAIAMRDDCDPTDPAWAPTGGCLLREGDVKFAEFVGELPSPLSPAFIGHQAWRMDPTYVELKAGETLRVKNRGGRIHTFTEVANFGGGKVPVLNGPTTPAPECPLSQDIPARGRTDVRGLAVGNHRFQCCIHPWMRALVKVKAEGN